MKPITARLPQRPSPRSSAVVHSAKQAAIHLVRLEFDRARLASGLAQAKSRMNRLAEELSQNDAERKTLLAVLKTEAKGGADGAN